MSAHNFGPEREDTLPSRWSAIEETANGVAVEAFLVYLFTRLKTGEAILNTLSHCDGMLRYPDGVLRILVDGYICSPFEVKSIRGKTIASVVLEENEAKTLMAYIRRTTS
jgi:hypothetical protein